MSETAFQLRKLRRLDLLARLLLLSGPHSVAEQEASNLNSDQLVAAILNQLEIRRIRRGKQG